MKIKVSTAEGATLNWMVAKAEGFEYVKSSYVTGHPFAYRVHGKHGGCEQFWPSTHWAQGGPIIDREKIDTRHIRALDVTVGWEATIDSGDSYYEGPTPLVAAMRCYCCAKFGDIVDVPEELCQQQSS